MNSLTRLLKWILKAAVFFVLFAFALNNPQDATLHLLFGRQWRAPMVLIVLAAFASGVVIGVLGMLPGWWSRRGRKLSPVNSEMPPLPERVPAATAATPEPPHGV